MIAAVPAQFASAVAKETGLQIYEPPIKIPVPKIEIYWHRRHDKNPTHMWLREQILAAADF